MGLAYWGKQFSELGSKVRHTYTKRRTIPMPVKGKQQPIASRLQSFQTSSALN